MVFNAPNLILFFLTSKCLRSFFLKIQSRYIMKNQSVKMLPYCESTEAFVWGKSQDYFIT